MSILENVGALMTRGVMIDVAALKGVDMLSDKYEITVQDLQQALAAEKLTLQSGDAVIIHTGWGKLWEKTMRVSEQALRVSESLPPNGWLARILCWSDPTTQRLRFRRILIRSSPVRFTRSCWL